MKETLEFQVVYEPFEENGVKGFNVRVPALPGCFTWGETMDHAKDMAVDAILLYLQALQAKGEPFPSDAEADPVVLENITVPIPA